MGLACNLLTAIGGVPNIFCAGFVPKYPGPLPGNVHPGLRVGLAGLAKDDATDSVKKKEVVQTFMQIELPEKPLALERSHERAYKTIGEFYDAISQAFDDLQPSISLERQLLQTDVNLTTIAVLQDAKDAITLIKTQGEGTDQSPFSPNAEGRREEIVNEDELAHYYKFASIYYEHKLKRDVNAPLGYSFTGDPLPFPPEQELYLMAEVPPGGYEESADFDEQYTSILKMLHFAWANGDASLLDSAIFGKTGMDNLTSKALDLLKLAKPSGSGKGIIGPSFVFRP